MIRKIVCLLLMPAFMVKSTALSCPHVHVHSAADHSSVVHFHIGGHSHHGHDHDHGHDHRHDHGPVAHGHHDQGSVDDSGDPMAHCHEDASGGDVSQLCQAEEGIHSGEVLVFGSRVDLSNQSASSTNVRSTDASTPSLIPPAPKGFQFLALQRIQAECSLDRAFLERRQLLGLHDCARIPLFLQILCLLI